MKELFCPMLLRYPKEHCFSSYLASPVYPSDKSRFKITMSMEHWWHDIDREKPKALEEKRVPVQLCPSRMSQELARDRTQDYVVRGRHGHNEQI
jgi:hypothetical protein